jgi:hypothetical protein
MADLQKFLTTGPKTEEVLAQHFFASPDRRKLAILRWWAKNGLIRKVEGRWELLPVSLHAVVRTGTED